MNRHENEQLIIAGPCAAESRGQVLISAQEARIRGLEVVRLSLVKPRTRRGWDGAGELGIPWLVDAAKVGIVPATEVATPKHAEVLMRQLLEENGVGKVVVWIGARNQNHWDQTEIASIVNDSRVKWMIIKNPLSPNLDHWLGIVDHVTGAGFPEDRVVLCHRGFDVTSVVPNPMNLRNIPIWELAAKAKEESGLPMITDLSHIAGTRENVPCVLEEALHWEFDGFMIEVHPNPHAARTDANQQLTWEQFDEVLEVIRHG